MIIYKAENKINGKLYIGQTIRSLTARRNQHLNNARKGVSGKFYDAIREYGEDNFEFSVICKAYSKDELDDLERYYIAKYNTVNDGYNSLSGGSANVMEIPSVKEKHKKILGSDEIRQKISKGMKNYRAEHPFSSAHRQKLSQKAIGNNNGNGNSSHSVACYCTGKYGVHEFKNYKEAGIWWYETCKPFGETYSQTTYQRKIIDCIEKGYCKFSKPGYRDVTITSDEIKWFRK